jgi:GT2 family glycosyltransferase
VSTGPAPDARSGADRDAVDVVIPFAGADERLRALLVRLGAIRLAPGDGLFVADNRPATASPVSAPDNVKVVRAPGRRSSYYARNLAAGAGCARWVLFLDADVRWGPEVIDAYFDPPPGERTAIVGGQVIDASLAPDRTATAAARYAVRNATMAASTTLERQRPYAQTANCLVRRAAFEAVGGFADGVRSGGDADLCFRLAADGWQLERRSAAAVVHENRSTIAALLRQKARHGAGAAWVQRRHPGAFERARLPGLALWSLQITAAALPDRRATADAALDAAAVWAFELGRLLPNESRSGRRTGRR